MSQVIFVNNLTIRFLYKKLKICSMQSFVIKTGLGFDFNNQKYIKINGMENLVFFEGFVGIVARKGRQLASM